MPIPGQDNPGATDPPNSGAPVALRVLLLVAHDKRRDAMLQLIGRLAPTSQVETVGSMLDAMRRLARAHADLLILDHAMEGVAGLSLIRHLARAAPSLSLLAFDEVVDSLTDPGCELWSWSQAEQALQRWIDRRLQPGAQPR